MAYYMKPKLNWKKLLKLHYRSLSSKLETIALSNTNHNEEEREIIIDDSGSNRRYNVCRDRTSSSQKFVFEHKRSSTAATDEQEQLEQTSVPLEEDITNTSNINTGNSMNGYRMFTASTTYKNVILPLKSSKLANPFPEPVKVMPSHTVSDQEKADQMQAECRVPRSIKKTNRIN